MTSLEILNSENIYFGQETIDGIKCNIGYIKKFKWSWLATQLNTMIIIGDTAEKIDKKRVEKFSESCFEYALKNHKGWPRGIQSGVCSIAILQGNDIEKEAIDFCENFSKKHWSAFEIPVLFHSKDKTIIRYKSSPMWGKIYFPYITKTIDRITHQL